MSQAHNVISPTSAVAFPSQPSRSFIDWRRLQTGRGLTILAGPLVTIKHEVCTGQDDTSFEKMQVTTKY